jgi:hypothetical protein
MIADELRRQADHFIDLASCNRKVGRDPSERPARPNRATRRSFPDEFEQRATTMAPGADDGPDES